MLDSDLKRERGRLYVRENCLCESCEIRELEMYDMERTVLTPSVVVRNARHREIILKSSDGASPRHVNTRGDN